MLYKNETKILEAFLKNRNLLIDKLIKQEVSKQEFLIQNYEYFRQTNAKPFLLINTYEKALYNYQYYNLLAKYYFLMAKEAMNNKKQKTYHNKALNYYNEKDKTIKKLIEFVNTEEIEAYYIETNSKNLNGSLFEIIIKCYEKNIFHSKSSKLLEILKNKNVFKNITKKSVIDSYINIVM